MNEKPRTASGYTREQTELVKRACLYVATKLGDLMEELVVVGGLVSSLLIPENDLAQGVNFHVGSMDLDIGLSLALLEGKRSSGKNNYSWSSFKYSAAGCRRGF